MQKKVSATVTIIYQEISSLRIKALFKLAICKKLPSLLRTKLQASKLFGNN
jgi:hypothetical protein